MGRILTSAQTGIEQSSVVTRLALACLVYSSWVPTVRTLYVNPDLATGSGSIKMLAAGTVYLSYSNYMVAPTTGKMYMYRNGEQVAYSQTYDKWFYNTSFTVSSGDTISVGYDLGTYKNCAGICHLSFIPD